MQKIDSDITLRAAIIELENRQAGESRVLKEQFHVAYESMKPINIIKSTFKEVTASPELKDELLTTGVGMAAGYLSKVLFQGASHSPLRKLFGTVLMFGVTNVVARHPEEVKAAGKGLLRVIIGIPNKKQGARTQ